MKIIFEEYKKAILDSYEIAKNGEKSHYLLDPTPASLKKLATEMCEQISSQDEAVFNAFFGYKSDVENKTKAISVFDTDKFRPLSKFLNGKSNLQEIPNANLLAILVDFENRPFLKFKKNQVEDKKEGIISEKIIIEDVRRKAFSGEVQVQHLKHLPKKTFFSKPIIVLCLTLFIALSAFSLHKTFEKKCMIWNEDHYEKIDCENTNNGFANYATVLPIDTNLLDNFKK